MSHHARRDDTTRPRTAELYTLARRLDSLAELLRSDGRPAHALAAENIALQLREIEFTRRPALRVV